MTTSASKIRNIAIIAHVDHGKTTLVDAMLWQTGTYRANQKVAERALDSMDQERERGITIMSKNAAVQWQGMRINLVDTPGHADFGGEVERGISMVDGVLLLVDASEGPLPQTRFVLRKALERHLPVILVINKVDRPDARIAEVIDETYELFLDLDADEGQIDFPIVYCCARDGWASTQPDASGEDLTPLFEAIQKHVPAPEFEPDLPLQALVTNLDASPYLGRIALCRIHQGTIKRGQNVAWCRIDGSVKNVKITDLLMAEGLDRVNVDTAGPGDIVAIAGIEEVTIGETIADPEAPVPLPVITVDEPSIGMTIGINTSPLAGLSGSKLTARMIHDRLQKELVGNISLRVLPTERPDTWEVQGRGEMHLAVLIETLRREGFELTVSKPQVVVKEVDGKLCEPIERVYIDVPTDHQGVVTQLIANRKGRLQNIINHGTGWIRMEYLVPARGLIGFRTHFLTETRGTGILNHIFEGYEPWLGELRTRTSGSLVSDRSGPVTAHAAFRIQERGTLFVKPGDQVYEGSIVGENVRGEDLDVNAVREKKLTNMRSATADELERLAPPKVMGLEEALEFIKEDECVEVTPDLIRIRKVYLSRIDRALANKRAVAREAGAEV